MGMFIAKRERSYKGENQHQSCWKECKLVTVSAKAAIVFASFIHPGSLTETPPRDNAVSPPEYFPSHRDAGEAESSPFFQAFRQVSDSAP